MKTKFIFKFVVLFVLIVVMFTMSGYDYICNPTDITVTDPLIEEKTEIDSSKLLIGETRYQVQLGDTLCKIAKAYYGDPMMYKIIASTNNIINANIIYVGQTLIIPEIEPVLEDVKVYIPTTKTEAFPNPETVVVSDTEVTPEEYIEFSEDASFSSGFTYIDCGLSHELQEFTYNLCEEYGLPFELAMAVMKNESGFRIDVVSGTGDYGLMQINSTNHKWLRNTLGISDFLNAEENITAGVYLINYLWQRYPDAHKCMMAYNMGEGGAMTQWKQGIYTSHYSRLVVGTMDEYLAR